jgi:hypothetical protein
VSAWQVTRTYSDLIVAVRGEVHITRISDGDDFQVRIDRADRHVLITADFVDDAFRRPTEILFAEPALDGEHIARIVLNGCNRRVDYNLIRYHPNADLWEAKQP